MNSDGIVAFVKKLRPHDHMMLFYADSENRDIVLNAFFIAGFNKGGSALFVGSESSISGMRETMRRLGLDCEGLEARRRVRFERCDPWYMKDRKVDIPSIMRNWKKALSESEGCGSAQFLAAGCTKCFFQAGHVEQLCDYEGSLGRKPNLAITAICNYDEKDLASVSALTLLRLLKAHEYVGYVASDLEVARVINFSSAFVKAVEDSMKELVGEVSMEGFFKYMEKTHSLPRDQISSRFEEFENDLHEIFVNGAPIIEKAIVDHLMSALGAHVVR